ncbi:hypothetical protein IGS68_33055 (plasmid) [Skermanella sp. TT6]|uniref:Uncharacterized protein n=1 Tax=Skermanella cutis TaxID=2775420 RepID=A0ABX7BLY8_9PROT|nr:hypothetical protein [Skermanella sp. TT6]QQP93453.1 hypothetical protein IGS68_33055 [Skermanella sp. TT6]
MTRFLALCGEQREEDGVFTAPFRPESYAVLHDPSFAGPGIPPYLVVEAMAQHACRASSAVLFDGRRTVPAQVSDLGLAPVPEGRRYRLVATVGGRGQFGSVRCELIDPDGAVVASGHFTTSAIEPRPAAAPDQAGVAA